MIGRLQQGELPIHGGRFLRLRRQRRNIGRIDNLGPASPRAIRGQETREVVGVRKRAGLAPVEHLRLFVIQFVPLRFGEKLLLRILGGAFLDSFRRRSLLVPANRALRR
jgi:hypothetical protein